jgi:AhpD family alkylhydroperoxidase
VDEHARRDEGPWPFAYEETLEEVASTVHATQTSWLAALDSLMALDRRTHELIRMVCTAIARSDAGVERHARLAAEAGASWEEIAAALLLTPPAFGLLPSVHGLEPARRGYEAAETEES